MQVLSGLAYRERLNPWINKNVHVAHGVPLVFPAFRFAIANEVFLFAAGILIVIATFLGISLLFSLPIFNDNNFNEHTFVTSKQIEAIAIFSALLIAYFRIVYFIFSKLNHDFPIVILGFLTIVSIPYIAEGLPTLKAWLAGNAVHYSYPSLSVMIIIFFFAHFLTQKLLQQFHEAKAKDTAKVN